MNILVCDAIIFKANLKHMITCLPNRYRNAIPVLASTKNQ